MILKQEAVHGSLYEALSLVWRIHLKSNILIFFFKSSFIRWDFYGTLLDAQSEKSQMCPLVDSFWTIWHEPGPRYDDL